MSASQNPNAPVQPLRVSVEQAFRTVFDVPLEVPEYKAIKYIEEGLTSGQLTATTEQKVAGRYTLIKAGTDIDREGFLIDNVRLEIANAYLEVRKLEFILEGINSAIAKKSKEDADTSKLDNLYSTQTDFMKAVANAKDALKVAEDYFHKLQEPPSLRNPC